MKLRPTVHFRHADHSSSSSVFAGCSRTRTRILHNHREAGSLLIIVLWIAFGLVATGQIILRKLDGYTQLAAVIRQRMRSAA